MGRPKGLIRLEKEIRSGAPERPVFPSLAARQNPRGSFLRIHIWAHPRTAHSDFPKVEPKNLDFK